jgi:hypothetical protein
MAMRAGAPGEGLKAVGLRTDIVGLSLGKLQEGVYLAVGWNARQQIEILHPNTQLCLAWPRSSAFYQARIGSEFPTTLDDCASAGGGKNP